MVGRAADSRKGHRCQMAELKVENTNSAELPCRETEITYVGKYEICRGCSLHVSIKPQKDARKDGRRYLRGCVCVHIIIPPDSLCVI